jgi:peptidoglycan/LPS O-acetylase OafA/YrhL
MSERLRGSEQRRPRRGGVRQARTAAKARRQRIVWGIVLLALVAAGAVLAATSEGSAVRSALAILMLGGAAVLVVSLAFLEVGLSEDRERESRFGRPSRDHRVEPEREQRSERFFRK